MRIHIPPAIAFCICLSPVPAQAGVQQHQIIYQNVSAQIGTPAGLQTWAISLSFTHPDDVLLSHTGWSASIVGGSFFNADPIADDPFGQIPDDGGHTPISAILLGFPGYSQWICDTNISIDNSPQSIADADTSMSASTIGPGGATVGSHTAAGGDLLIQIAQITFTAGTPVIEGSFIATTQSHDGAAAVCTEHFFVLTSPPPADLNLDFRVDGLDLGILLANWSIPAGTLGCDGDVCCRADINNDGVVDGLDLGILLAHWDVFP